MPPDRKVLEARLRKRSLDTDEVIQRRLVTASREIENYEKYDYILVNDRLDESIEALQAILLAERLKRSGVQVSADDARTLAKAESCRLNNIRERLQPILASFSNGSDFGRALATGENTMKLIEGFDSNYRYILVAARRARQLQGGAPPVIETHSRKPCRIAQDEIKAGKVKVGDPGDAQVDRRGSERNARQGAGARVGTCNCRLPIA